MPFYVNTERTAVTSSGSYFFLFSKLLKKLRMMIWKSLLYFIFNSKWNFPLWASCLFHIRKENKFLGEEQEANLIIFFTFLCVKYLENYALSQNILLFEIKYCSDLCLEINLEAVLGGLKSNFFLRRPAMVGEILYAI